MHLRDGSGCSRVRGRWRTRLRRHADYPDSRRNILDNNEEMENWDKIRSKISKRSVKIMNNYKSLLTGLCAPPGAGAPTAAWPRPERVK